MNKELKRVLVTGGAGYVGSLLVPSLLEKGYKVKVFDTYWFREDIFKNIDNKNLTQVKGDIRNKDSLNEASKGMDAIINLACIANDPGVDLNPKLGKSINYNAFFNVISAAEENKVKRLIVASSTSQYGIKPSDLEVTEDIEGEPITDYARYKLECEKALNNSYVSFEYVFARPATLAGYAPRLRLDLSVNILTINALVNKRIKIFGTGEQMRPMLNIKDMVRFYETLLEADTNKINRQAFNLSYQNLSIKDLGLLVKDTLNDPSIQFELVESNDNRSYHVNTDKVKRVLGFEFKHDLKDAIHSIREAYEDGLIIDGLTNPLYYNLERMKQLNLN